MAVKSRQAIRTGRVTASQALRIARRFGVALDLSNDIELAGKWKHGWIPLDAVAAAVKAKRYKGGDGREVRGKGRGGSLVESMRRPATGRAKTMAPDARGKMSHNDRIVAEADSFGEHAGWYHAGMAHASKFESMHDYVKAEHGDKAARAYAAGHARVDPRGEVRQVTPETSRHFGEIGKRAEKRVTERYGDNTYVVSKDADGLATYRLVDGPGIPGVIGPKAAGGSPGGRDISPATRRAQQVAQDRTRRLQNAEVQQSERDALTRRAVQGNREKHSNVRIRPTNYRGAPGHIVSGKSESGKQTKVFVPGARAAAEHVAGNLKAGRPTFRGLS